MSERTLTIKAITGIGEIEPGFALGTEIAARHSFAAGEILVISQKAVSKAEGRLIRLSEVEPSPEAHELSARLEGKDPRLVELVLRESRAVIRAVGSVLITETHHGFICANAGIDASNMPEDGVVAALPRDPDASARRIRAEIAAATALSPPPAVLVSDSFGRPWRLGQCETAIGCAGIAPLDDWRGREDSSGRVLAATAIARADQLAAAADLTRDKTSRTPAVVIGGLGQHVTAEHGPGAAALARPAEQDLFR